MRHIHVRIEPSLAKEIQAFSDQLARRGLRTSFNAAVETILRIGLPTSRKQLLSTKPK